MEYDGLTVKFTVKLSAKTKGAMQDAGFENASDIVKFLKESIADSLECALFHRIQDGGSPAEADTAFELLKESLDLITSVQAELLAGGSPARLRAIVGIKPEESTTNAERS